MRAIASISDEAQRNPGGSIGFFVISYVQSQCIVYWPHLLQDDRRCESGRVWLYSDIHSSFSIRIVSNWRDAPATAEGPSVSLLCRADLPPFDHLSRTIIHVIHRLRRHRIFLSELGLFIVPLYFQVGPTLIKQLADNMTPRHVTSSLRRLSYLVSHVAIYIYGHSTCEQK